MTEIYLDNSATTRTIPEVSQAVRRVLEEDYGNPSSLHGKGAAAERLLEETRRSIRSELGATEGKILFTSGGTEANNLALKGAARARRHRGKHIVTSAVEHPSVLNAVRALEEEGFEATYLDPDGIGCVDPDQVRKAIRSDTILVSIMHVNNEVGTIQPVEEIGRLVAEVAEKAVFHVDLVQSFTKLPLSLDRIPAALATVSAHKIHGPKGAGALYIRPGTTLEPLFSGGYQEAGLRAGTENVPGIAGMGAAVQWAAGKREAMARMKELRRLLCECVLSEVPGTILNGPGPADERAAPHIASFSIPGIPGEMLVHHLGERGIFVSTGSACSSRRREPSHVLRAMQLPPSVVESAIRVSLSPLSTTQEVSTFCDVLAEVAADLKKLFRR